MIRAWLCYDDEDYNEPIIKFEEPPFFLYQNVIEIVYSEVYHHPSVTNK